MPNPDLQVKNHQEEHQPGILLQNETGLPRDHIRNGPLPEPDHDKSQSTYHFLMHSPVSREAADLIATGSNSKKEYSSHLSVGIPDRPVNRVIDTPWAIESRARYPVRSDENIHPVRSKVQTPEVTSLVASDIHQTNHPGTLSRTQNRGEGSGALSQPPAHIRHIEMPEAH